MRYPLPMGLPTGDVGQLPAIVQERVARLASLLSTITVTVLAS
jgi:hypothetical protein